MKKASNLDSGIADQGNPMEAAGYAEMCRIRPPVLPVRPPMGPKAEPLLLNGVPNLKKGDVK